MPLPGKLFNGILDAFPSAQPLTDAPGMYSVDCAIADTTGTVDVTFGEVVINIPFADFIWRAGADCILGVSQDDGELNNILALTLHADTCGRVPCPR